MILPRRPLRYALSLLVISSIFLFFYNVRSTPSSLSENANPEHEKDVNGNTKEPNLAPGVASVIDSHRGEVQSDFAFPGAIHQTARKETTSPAVLSWYYANPGEEHHFYGDVEAKTFVRTHGSSEIYEIYNTLQDVVARADIFRYVVMKVLGGAYADIDSTTLCPISAWIPAEFAEKKISLVIGVEVDEPSITSEASLAELGWDSNFQFVQWTFMVKPNHPALEGVLSEVIKRVKATAEKKQQSIGTMHLTGLEVTRTTGAGPFTAAILSYLGLDGAATLRGLTRPLQVKDVLIMPVTSFAPNQRHSKSKSVKYAENIPEVLVMHGFSPTGTWVENVQQWLKSKAY